MLERVSGMQNSQSLFKHSDFLKLWSAQTISVFGSQFSGLAIPLVATVTLNATSIQFGILSALGTSAFPTFGLFVGVWVDRHRRRNIMILSDIGRACFLFTIPAIALIGGLTMSLLYSVAFFVGFIQLFFDISYQSYLPSLVDRSQLVDANSKLETSRATAQAAGPSIAGLFIQAISAPLAILVDTLGYVGSALFLSRIGKREMPVQRTNDRSTWRDIRDGLSVVFGDGRLRSIVGTTATANLFSNALFAIYVPYAVRSLRLSPFEIGLAFSIGSLGAVLGALSSKRLAKRFGVGVTIILFAFLSGFPMIGIYLATPESAVVVLSIAWFISSVGVVVYNVNQVSFRQAIIPLDIQGRMNATIRTVVWGTLPLGGLIGGIMGQLLGFQTAIGVAAIGGTLSFVWVLFSPVRQVKEFPSAPMAQRVVTS